MGEADKAWVWAWVGGRKRPESRGGRAEVHRRSSWNAQQNVVSTLVGACCAGGAATRAPLGAEPPCGGGHPGGGSQGD